MESQRIRAVEHVRIEAPPGSDDALRWFYGEVGGLELVPAAAPDTTRLRFKSVRLELQIDLDDQTRVDPVGRRVTLFVQSLDDAAAKLDQRSVPYKRMSGLMFADRRIGTRDPAGNRVELKQGWPNAPL
jgi:hypothetical protein